MSKQKVHYLSLGIKKVLIFDISGVIVRSGSNYFLFQISLPVTVTLILIRYAALK